MLWVMLAGGAGAASRFVVDGAINSGRNLQFPWATIIINVIGSFLLGLFTGLVLFSGAPPSLTAIAGSGFCGGFTTFSTASVDAVHLMQKKHHFATIGYLFGTLILALLAGGIGLALASVL